MRVIGVFAFLILSVYSYSQENTDKTLVSWLSLDNLTQQGGSALSIQLGEKFDAIVFGEISPAKWMAGSNNFSRTVKDQESWPAEKVKGHELIQIAVVYKGDDISIYRNGVLLADYKSNNIDLLSSDYNLAVFGWRHIGAGKGYFSGSIEDARIYDRPLSMVEIKSLKPNEASSIKPYAWWDFEGADIEERTGRFIYHRMVEGAKLDSGRLLLDEKSFLVAAREEETLNDAASGKIPKGPLPPWNGEKPKMPEVIPDNWLSYHLAHPGPGIAEPGDPNCAFYYKGRYHLHYIYINKHGFAFAHVSSKDMVRWKWHETKLVPPNTGHGMFSGTGFFTKEGQPAIIYHGQGSERNFISFALDDNLDEWTKPISIEPKTSSGEDVEMRHWDPDCWLNGDTYYAISGGTPPHLIKSKDLKNWSPLGLLLHEDMPDIGVDKNEDVSCANMFKIGNKWMLLCISHRLGCRYYLGEFKNEKYLPEFHAMMNWTGWDFFAPESLLTKDGRRVMWAWCLLDGAQSGIQSLPRELSLPEDGVLRIKPLRELEKLRYQKVKENDIMVEEGKKFTLKTRGDILELEVFVEPTETKEFGVSVFTDKDGNGLNITIKKDEKLVMIADKEVPFVLEDDETLEMRIFLDHGLVEVFLNDRQAMNYMQEHDKEDVGINIFTKGEKITGEVSSWKMRSIYE